MILFNNNKVNKREREYLNRKARSKGGFEVRSFKYKRFSVIDLDKRQDAFKSNFALLLPVGVATTERHDWYRAGGTKELPIMKKKKNPIGPLPIRIHPNAYKNITVEQKIN